MGGLIIISKNIIQYKTILANRNIKAKTNKIMAFDKRNLNSLNKLKYLFDLMNKLRKERQNDSLCIQRRVINRTSSISLLVKFIKKSNIKNNPKVRKQDFIRISKLILQG